MEGNRPGAALIGTPLCTGSGITGRTEREKMYFRSCDYGVAARRSNFHRLEMLAASADQTDTINIKELTGKADPGDMEESHGRVCQRVIFTASDPLLSRHLFLKEQFL